MTNNPPETQHPVASTRSSDPESVRDLLPAAQALARGDAEGALAILEGVALQRPDDPPVKFVLGLLAWRSDDLAGAIDLVRQAHEADPDNGSYAEVLAALYAAVGDLQESLFLGKLATGMGLDATLHQLVPPDFPTFGRAFLAIEERPLVVAARNAEARNRTMQAIRYLRDHLGLFPHDRDAWRDLIRLLMSERRFGEAATAAASLQGIGSDAEILSLAGHARCAAGDLAAASGVHEAAVMIGGTDRTTAREIGARRLADMWWCEPDTDLMASACASWVERHCVAAPQGLHRPPPAVQGRLTIGFLLAGEVRPAVRLAVARIARAFNRQSVLPLGFGLGPASHPANTEYRNAFVRWRDLRQVDAATIARILSGEGLDVVIDAAGFGYAEGVRAVALSDVPLRLLWPQLPAAPNASPYDARLVAGTAGCPLARSLLAFGASDMPVVAPRPAAGMAASPSVGTEAATAAAAGEQPLVLGCDLQPAQASREMLTLLAAIAMAVPGAAIAIRDNGFSDERILARLLDGIGEEAAGAVHLIQAGDAATFCRYLDIAIAPLRPDSAEPVIAALLAGCPVLSLTRPGIRDGGYGGLLALAGLEENVAVEPADLIRKAAALVGDPDRLARQRRAIRDSGLQRHVSAAALADGLEQAVRRRLADDTGAGA